MAPRGRAARKSTAVGTTRMDAALDAMRQLGFEKRLVRETVRELLDVYEGNQGWPFIEEGSYKLLIETILGKQQNSENTEQDKEDSLQDNARGHDVAETSRVTEVGSSDMIAPDSLLPTARVAGICSRSLVVQDTLVHNDYGLDSASQTNDQGSTSLGNQEADVADKSVPTDGVRNEQCTVVRDSGIKPSKTADNVSPRRRKPFHGWVGSGNSDEKLVCFALPPLHIQLELLKRGAPKSDSSQRRRKRRWDEKPDSM